MKFSSQNFLFVGALAAVLAVIAFILPPAPVWITDNGSKYIIMRTYSEHNTVKLQHCAPELAPTGGFHIQHHEKNLRSFYPEFYPVLCSYFYSRNCERACAIPAAAGTLICAFLVLLWTKSKPLSTITALGTALFFYSFVLWEMTLSCAAITGALYLVLKKRRYLEGGLLMGASIFLREEAYFAVACLAFALAVFKEFKPAAIFLAGAVAGMVPSWIHQYIEFGHILGLHGKIYIAGTGTQSPAGILWNYFHHLLRGEPTGKKFETLFTIIPTFFMLYCGVSSNRKLKVCSVSLAIAAGCILLIRYVQNSGYSYSAACSTGFFAAVPAAWLFIADIRNNLTRQAKQYRILAVFVLTALLTVPAVLTRGDIGLIWSARHFMFLMPAVVILSGKSMKHFAVFSGRKNLILPSLLAAFAIAQQLAGVYSLYAVSNECSMLENTIRKMRTGIVASDVFFLPEMTPRLWFENITVDISKTDNVRKLIELRPKEILLVLSATPQFRRVPGTVLSEILKHYTPEQPVSFNTGRGTGFINLVIAKLTVREK